MINDIGNIGFLLQLVAINFLLLKIICTANCTGLSGKSQILYALVFTMRFLEPPYELKLSLLLFVVKCTYLLTSYLTVICIVLIFKKSYKHEYDTSRFEVLVGISALLALLACYPRLEVLDVIWYTGVFLETFAIFPQIQFTARSRYVGSSLLFYVGLLACFRGFHAVQWIYQLAVFNRLANYHLAVTEIAQFYVYARYFVWMVPLFKAQYKRVKSGDCQIIVQPDVLTIVQANGPSEAKKVEPLLA